MSINLNLEFHCAPRGDKYIEEILYKYKSLNIGFVEIFKKKHITAMETQIWFASKIFFSSWFAQVHFTVGNEPCLGPGLLKIIRLVHTLGQVRLIKG